MADTFYFSHDYDARQDEKIKDLLFNLGIEGYGIFWGLIEDLYINENRLKCDYKRIAYDYRTDELKVKSIINDFNLFVINEGYFYSESINKRLGIRNEKSEKAKKLAEKRWKNAKSDEHASKNDAGEYQHASKNDALASKNDAIKERKEKEIKEKEIKVNEIKGEREGALPPALVECVNIFSDLGHEHYAESFYNYYESNGWLKGSNPIVNITAAAKTWIEKENKLYNQNKSTNNGSTKQHPTNSAGTGITRFDETANEFLRSIGQL